MMIALGLLAFIILGLSFWQKKKTEILDHFEQVDTGVFRGAQPSHSDYQAMQARGIKTIVNLREKRFADEERDLAEAFGFKFLNFPMNGIFYPLEGQIENALIALQYEGNHPVMVHCTYGKDRTGCVVGMYRRAQGWSKKAAWKEMWAHGFNPVNIGMFLYYLLH